MEIGQELRSLWARMQSTVVRGILSRINDATKTQVVQVSMRSDELADAVEHMQPYGLSFHPTRGSEVVVLAVGGAQDNLVALGATNRSDRPTGALEGEGGLYTPNGWAIFCDKNGHVSITQKDATQPMVRGTDLKTACTQYANAVTQAVSGITYAGTGSVSSAAAAAQLQTAASQFASALTQALSQKAKTE